MARILNIKGGNAEAAIPIPLPEYTHAEQLREEFLLALASNPLRVVVEQQAEQSVDLDDAQQRLHATQQQDAANLELFSHFLAFVARKCKPNSAASSPQMQAADRQHVASINGSAGSQFEAILQCSFEAFTTQYLSTSHSDVHTLVKDLETPEQKREVLNAYFAALSVLRHQANGAIVPTPKSSLLEKALSGDAVLYAVFGGQGINEVCFDELLEMYESYQDFVKDYIKDMSATLVNLAQASGAIYFSQGLDILSWLERPSARPDVDYLVTAPVSLPVIGLVQFVRVLVICKILSVTPGELSKHFKGTTGHSQGIVTAVAFASSNSFESFKKHSTTALTLLFWIGTRSQQVFPSTTLNPAMTQDCLSSGEGQPTPMLSIVNLPKDVLMSFVEKTNAHQTHPENHIGLALANGPRNFVVAGPPQSLYGLILALRKMRAAPGVDQSRVPYSDRKRSFTVRFLGITAPFHSPLLQAAVDIIKKDMQGFSFPQTELVIPVYSTDDGREIKTHHSDVISSLIEQICIHPIQWQLATAFDSATHVVDFGPGGASGIGSLLQRNKDGRGCRTVLSQDIFNSKALTHAVNWEAKWHPRLVRTKHDNRLHISTPFSQLLGKPPLMVPGMTPCTVPGSFNAAIINAGYHVELAGGGHFNEQVLTDKINWILKRIEPGQGITLNALFLNQFLWSFQYPAIQKLRRQGVPIEGFTFAAGVPSLDVATKYVQELKDAGLKHVSMKPGNVESIRRTIAIASAHPDYPIILQWTGGLAGGHHSFEDVHTPILQTYAQIRAQPNIVLVAGSGLGDADGTWAYLSGEWALEYGYPPMPFDGALYGSRVMIAKEAETSPACKQLIANAKGVDHWRDWEKTYKGEAGGVITVKSELGEPIHKIATRGVLLWKDLDESIFALPKAKRGPAVEKRRDEIIRRLNADFQKVYFGKKVCQKDQPPCEIGEMTYEEVAKRLVELLYIAHQKRWVDVTLREMTGLFMRRIEERFAGKEKESMIRSYEQFDTHADGPNGFIEQFFSAYPSARNQLLTSEDVSYFLILCRRLGQKPVPFIPVLDNEIEFWFKKDSLWQSEDIEAVVGQDAGRVAILQGPVAVKHANKVDEPIKDILGNIENKLVEYIKTKYYPGGEDTIPVVEYFGGLLKGEPASDADLARWGVDVRRSANKSTVSYSVPSQAAKAVVSVDSWLQSIAGSKSSWLKAFLTTDIIFRRDRYVSNPLRRLLRLKDSVDTRIDVEFGADDIPKSVSVYDRPASTRVEWRAAFSVWHDSQTNTITLNIFEYLPHTKERIPLTLLFTYRPDMGFAPIHEKPDDRNARIKAFYHKLWFGKDYDPASMSAKTVFETEPKKIEEADIAKFCQAIGNQASAYARRSGANAGKPILAPLDFSIALGWTAITRAIFPQQVDGDLLNLVHLSNSFRCITPASSSRPPLLAGDVVQTKASLTAVINQATGKLARVRGILYRQEVDDWTPVIEVTSEFFYRGEFDDFEHTFVDTQEAPIRYTLTSGKDVSLLKSKQWFQWRDEKIDLPVGMTLIFRLTTRVEYKNETVFSLVKTSGSVEVELPTNETVIVAEVDYDETTDSYGNPVLDFLRKNGQPIEQSVPFEEGGYTIVPTADNNATTYAPSSNTPYAIVSGDTNPIHVNPYFADLASLPGTITHGMWTSASTRKFVEVYAAENVPERVKAYEAKFTSMVLPTDRLETRLSHVGMKNGRKIIKIATVNQDGITVLEGTAEVDQPVTTYVFTGQGSQEQGMGMDLYASSPVARAIWDRADKHFIQNYGFSILEIVRSNPKEKTVHFGGIRGKAIRQHYMDLTYDVVEQDGSTRTMSLFPEITEHTSSYVFKHPTGLLSATQFTQPALTLMERAAFDDMTAKGLVQEGCSFAGHSLGEYSAISAIAGVLPIEGLIDVVFYRGMTMQNAVPRDSQNRSNYGMCAVNPSRVSKTFTDDILQRVVNALAQQSGGLLEIVNYNVENQQYVVAGDLLSLDALSNVLNYIKMQKIDIGKLTEILSIEDITKKLDEIIANCLETSKAKKEKSGFIKMERGFATIPLPGIDVPFHSSFLLGGVSTFRSYLSKKIDANNVNVNNLIGKYIPNLTAMPYALTKEYIEEVYDLTSSPRLDRVLKTWSDEKYARPSQAQQRLGYTLLVELLAYQFASAVRWIETQDQLFTAFRFERMIEVGPSPTLAGMAQRTLKAKYEAYDDALMQSRTILCYTKNAKEIYYHVDPPLLDASADAGDAVQASAPAATVAPATSAPSAATPAPAASAGPAAPVADEPIKAIDVLRVIIAQKLKKTVEEIGLTKAIKDLVGGKSTLQNEILGDLQAEFGAAPEKSEEIPLDELAMAITPTFNKSLGKHTNTLIARMISQKMPGGFTLTNVKGHLTKTWGLGPGRIDGALLFSLTLEPATRLANEGDAKAWLDNVANKYASYAGISLSSGSTGGDGVGGGSVAVINSEDFDKLQAKQQFYVRKQLELGAEYLGEDLRTGHKLFEAEQLVSKGLQTQVDSFLAEHGDVYVRGIEPSFSALKARRYDSYWNWVRQDALTMFYDIIFGRLETVDRDITAQCLRIMNRSNPGLISYMQYYIDACPTEKGEKYALAKELGQILINNCREAVSEPPMYKDVTFPTAPETRISERGEVQYKEVNREGVRKLEDYVKEMGRIRKSQSDKHLESRDPAKGVKNMLRKRNPTGSPTPSKTLRNIFTEVSRSFDVSRDVDAENRRRRRSSSFAAKPQFTTTSQHLPHLHIKRQAEGSMVWEYNSKLTSVYLDVLMDIARTGVSYANKTALITGCGKDSIGVEVLKGLLAGGAKLIVTTSRYSKEITEYYQNIFQRHGARGSTLIVVPFNQGSKRDVEALIDYVYTEFDDLDFMIPFAAIPENGREIDGIDSKSELAHRIMLTNLLRLMGCIKVKKANAGFETRPTQVILPLSPNHGTLGNDGLYGESKIALETLFNRWYAESWSNYLTIAGAVIGWTRGTGLMSAINSVAQGIEQLGIRTFSTQEMGFNILGLMHPLVVDICQLEPVWADLTGGMGAVPDLNDALTKIRMDIKEESEIRKAIVQGNSSDFAIVRGNKAADMYKPIEIQPRANLKFEFPTLSDYSRIQKTLPDLKDMLDLENVIVITGFGEVGPYGNSRTRWEMEAKGSFSLEGCIELAWIMGLIKHHDGMLKTTGKPYSGWVDAKSGEPVNDHEIKGRYEDFIIEHTGIRLIEPELFDGYDPLKKEMIQEVVLEQDLAPFEASKDEAEQFKRQHGEKVEIYAMPESGQWAVLFKKGASLFLPKALQFDRLVAGQIPTGWDAARYGVPKDIIDQVDIITLYVLVSTVEALVMSGVTDPYEFYEYVHVSEVGNTAGSGMGGMRSLRKMYKDRLKDKPVQKDVLQETFINTMPAWINMLILSSAGPIKTPVGACATAVESVEIGCDTIQSGKAKVVIVGGYDDFHEEGSTEFANMKATSNTETEFAQGRTPKEMSRPATTSRAGFMESQGAGIQILMQAKLAIQMGVPIYGIVALSNTATDKEGRSVPAPGQGILTTAREVSGGRQSQLLDIKYRRRQLAFRRKQIKAWVEMEHDLLKEELEQLSDQTARGDLFAARSEEIELQAKKQEKEALNLWCNLFWKQDPSISALRGALASFGLTVDDIGVASFHGTSTQANDKNESDALNKQFKHLGRSKGNAVPTVWQKWLTGHPKGAAAAWMLNGVLQVMQSGIVPGNR